MTVALVVDARRWRDRYLAGLNACFAGGWTEAEYRWYHERPFGGFEPDVLAVEYDARPVAGVALNYRTLELPNGRHTFVALLTAAWTLPEHRGRWHFWRLIKAARGVARAKGCSALLGFATVDNASSVILRRFGAIPIETFYLTAGPNDPLSLPERLPALQECETRPWVVGRCAVSGYSFHYCEAEWRSQILERPHPTAAFEAADHRVVIEAAGETLRLQWLDGARDARDAAFAATLAFARARGRHFFHFTVCPSVAERAATYGVGVRKGNLLVLDLHDRAPPELQAVWVRGSWNLQSGERM